MKNRVRSLVTVVVNRSCRVKIIQKLCRASCRICLISYGNVVAAIASVLLQSEVDLCSGIGGIPEALLSAAVVNCLGEQ